MRGRPADNSQVGQSGAAGHTWTYVLAKSSIWTGNVSSSTQSVMLVFNTGGAFQCIYTLQGIILQPEDMRRLVADPAAARADTPLASAFNKRPPSVDLSFKPKPLRGSANGRPSLPDPQPRKTIDVTTLRAPRCQGGAVSARTSPMMRPCPLVSRMPALS